MHGKMGITKRYEQGRAQMEGILRWVETLRIEYLRGNFWPVCGLTGALLLFFAAAIVVPA